jgi:uncharacterized protein YbaP (TraB family)
VLWGRAILKAAFAWGALALLFCAAPADAFDPCTDAAHYVPLERSYTRGLLFKVEKCGSPASYLFGTAHLSRPEVSSVAGPAFLKLNEVQAAGFELAESAPEIAAWFQKYLVTPGDTRTLSSMIGKDYFTRMVDELKVAAAAKGRTVKPEALEKMKPWAAAVVMEVVDEDQGTVLDEKLRDTAIWLKKPVFGLETLQEQSDLFTGMPEASQIRMLRETIDHYPEMRADKAALIDAYLAQDAGKIEGLETHSIAVGEDKEFDDMMMDRLITRRNRIMEQRLRPRLDKQSVLVAVGVAHLMGPQGILHLLEQDGYFITPLP